MESLGMAAARAACVAALMAGAMDCRAASDHEKAVGAQLEQLCDARTLATLGRVLQVPNFKEPELGHDADANAVVAAAACRAAPTYGGRLVAAAYRSGHDNDLLLAIVVLGAGGQAGATFKGNLESDPAVKIVSGSLWLDTAAYDLAPGVRAFGIDIASDAVDNAVVRGGVTATRNLFVQQGTQLRLVLDGFVLTTSTKGADGLTKTSSKLALASTASHGFADMLVTRSIEPGGSKDHATLVFDGTRYGVSGGGYARHQLTEQ